MAQKRRFVNGFDKGLLFESRTHNDKPTVITEEYPGVEKGDLLLNFVDSIINNKQLIVDVDDVFRTMSVCFAMEKSMNLSKAVKVTYL